MYITPVFLLLFTCFYTVLSLGSERFSYKSLLELKCDGYLGRSLYYNNLCYLIVDVDHVQCSTVISSFNVVERQLNYATLKQLRFLKEYESTFEEHGKKLINSNEQLCVLESPYLCPPDSKLIGFNCWYLNQKKRTHAQAMKDCEYKGMQMFYPHSDKEIITVIELVSDNDVSEVWLSAIKQTSEIWDMNDRFATFDYARWFETTLLTTSSKMLYTTLSVGNNGSVPLGYMNVFEHSSTRRLPTICSSIPSSEQIVVATTSTTSTETTTTTTSTTTTRQPLCEDGSWTMMTRPFEYPPQPFCVKIFSLPNPYTTTYTEAAPICSRVGATVALFKNVGLEPVHVALQKMNRPVWNLLSTIYAIYLSSTQAPQPVLFATYYTVEKGFYTGGIYECDNSHKGLCTPSVRDKKEIVGIACAKNPIYKLTVMFFEDHHIL